jgi:phosphatidylglycerophosphatase A
MIGFVSRMIATFFGAGYVTKVSGTVGSVLALVILWFLPPVTGWWLWIGLPALFLIGVWASTRAETYLGHDANSILIDEIAGQWLVLAFVPKKAVIWIIGFFLFRAFDVLKPFPVNKSQKLPGGWGIMVDDVLAGLYALILIRIGLVIVGYKG